MPRPRRHAVPQHESGLYRYGSRRRRRMRPGRRTFALGTPVRAVASFVFLGGFGGAPSSPPVDGDPTSATRGEPTRPSDGGRAPPAAPGARGGVKPPPP